MAVGVEEEELGSHQKFVQNRNFRLNVLGTMEAVVGKMEGFLHFVLRHNYPSFGQKIRIQELQLDQILLRN